MPRSPDNRAPNVDDRTARLAYIAGRIEGIPVAGIPAWAKDKLELDVSNRRLQDATAAIRATSPHKQTPGRKTPQPLVRGEPIIQNSLVVDEPKLGLLRVLFRLGNDGWPQPELLGALDGLTGVRQVIEVDSTRELLIVALAASLADADDLRARIEDLAPGRPVRRDLDSFESNGGAAATWRRLAAAAARAAS